MNKSKKAVKYSNIVKKYDDQVTRFAFENYKNKKDFGEDARLAFERHLKDLVRSEKNDKSFSYQYSAEKANDIIEFGFNRYMVECKFRKSLRVFSKL